MSQKFIRACGCRLTVLMSACVFAFATALAEGESVVLKVGVEAAGAGDGSDWQNVITLGAALQVEGVTELHLLAGDYPLTEQLSIADGSQLKIVGGYTGSGDEIGTAKSVIYRQANAGDMRLLQATGAQLVLENLAFTNAVFFAEDHRDGMAIHLTNCQTKMNNCAVRENGVNPGKYHKRYRGTIFVSGGSFEAAGCDISENIYNIYAGIEEVYGTGLYADKAEVVLRDTAINRNRARIRYMYNGSAVYVSSGSLLVTNCTFIGNYCWHEENYSRDSYGGGLCCKNAPCTITDTVFEGNWLNDMASWGGCVYIEGPAASLTRCLFKDNGIRPDGGIAGTAHSYDRGDVCLKSTKNPFGMTNCVFVGNSTSPSLRLIGGALQAHRVTVAGTKAAYGVSIEAGSASFSDSIFWDNALGDVKVETGASVEARYCNSADSLAGFGNMSIDPCFSEDGYGHLLSEAGYYANGGFTGGEWSVATVTSPIIDKGNPASDIGDEPQPNGHLPNLGGYAGTSVASRTKLGDAPLVDDSELKVFAYDVTRRTDSATVRGEVASTGGAAETVKVYVVWDSADRGTASMSDWANRAQIGDFAPWTLFTGEMSGITGPTVCRLVADNSTAIAFSSPAISFEPPRKATFSSAEISRVQRTTLYARAAISDDGGSDATLRLRIYPAAGSVDDAVLFDFNYGLVAEAGKTYELTATGLEPGTQYTVLIEAVNSAGVNVETKTCTTLTTAPHTFYASASGSGMKDGSDAANAFEGLQPALDVATCAGDEIIVAAGSYTACQAGGATMSYLYITGAQGLTIRGENAETTVIERGSELMRLLRMVDSTVALYDLTFKGALLNISEAYGHAVYGQNSHLTFNRCRFVDNGMNNGVVNDSAGHYGGAVATDGGSAIFKDCTFAANAIVSNYGETRNFGGGVWAKNAALELSGCLFATNRIHARHYGGRGGALYATGGSVLVTNCTFNGNLVTHDRDYGSSGTRAQLGGAIYLEGVPDSKIVDCVFDGNYSHDGKGCQAGGTAYLSGATGVAEISRCRICRGGVSGYTTYTIYDSGAITLNAGCATIANTLIEGGHSNAVEVISGTLAILNTTIVGNDTLGIAQWDGVLAVTNSIAWDNAAGGLLQHGGTADIAYSNFQGDEVWAGDGNLNADPQFRMKSKNGASPYCLRGSSPCVNAGIKGSWTADDLDCDSNPRVVGGVPDMGAFETVVNGLLLMVK